MRHTWLLLSLLLPGCDTATIAATAAVNVGALTVVGMTVPDLVVSAVSGRECSAVRVDRGQSYCEPMQAPPGPPPYCTRSIGSVDCWVTRPPTIPMVPSIVQGPIALTPAQEANRTAWWPGVPRDLIRLEPTEAP